jgi:hypothetical protein
MWLLLVPPPSCQAVDVDRGVVEGWVLFIVLSWAWVGRGACVWVVASQWGDDVFGRTVLASDVYGTLPSRIRLEYGCRGSTRYGLPPRRR